MHDGNLTLEFLGKPYVIRIQERDELSLHMTQPEIPRWAHPSILMIRMAQISDPTRMPFRISLRHLRATVRGAIIDEQQFPAIVGLRKDRPHGFAEKSLGVEENYNDRDKWFTAHSCGCSDR